MVGTETNSQEWGNPETARIRATHTSETTPYNERLLRTYHPELAGCDEVWVSDPRFGPEVWLVKKPCTAIVAAGRAIHPYPADRLDLCHVNGILSPRSPWKEEYLFRHGINPRKVLSSEQLDCLRELFPRATGARVHVAGFLIMLFHSYLDIESQYENEWIREVGGLRVLYEAPEVRVSADTVASGMEVSDAPSSLAGSGCLGLKLQMPDGKAVITTVTHGFVKNPHPSAVVKFFGEWILRANGALRRFFGRPPPSEACALGVSWGSQTNSPIGKEVWLAMENKRVSF